MALGLDLSESEAKIARARFHFESLDREIRATMNTDAYHVRVAEVDKDGCYSAFMRPDKIPKYEFGAIVGDLIHNLRSALDYIVTALVDRSAATPSTSHQFPIFETKAGYRNRVGSETIAKPGGMLCGVKYGLEFIWKLQPFHRQPSPEDHPLLGIQRLSNADKHRTIIGYRPFLVQGSGTWKIERGEIVELGKMTPIPNDGEADQEYEVGRVRIVAPPGTQLSYQPNVTVGIHFRTTAFADKHGAFRIDANHLKLFCDYVAKIVDSFKAL